MINLKNIRSQNFGEKISTLIEISQTKSMEFIPELFTLYTSPLGDKPVDAMVEHTLRDLLLENETETIMALKSNNSKIIKLCLQIIARKNFQSSAPHLIDLIPNVTGSDIFHSLLGTMADLKHPSFLPVFQNYIRHKDDMISAISVKMIGEYKDTTKINDLFLLIKESEMPDRFEACSITTAQTIETLAALKTKEAISFLVSKLHHLNPTVRRIVLEELVKMGTMAIPFIAKVYDSNDVDMKILATNVLTFMGEKEGGEVLIEALDDGKAKENNVKFAIYEAFGSIKFMKGLVCLTDALSEVDQLLLMSVMGSLDKQLNPMVITKIKASIAADDDQGRRILKAVIESESLEIFAALYNSSELADRLIKFLSLSNDRHIISIFTEKLKTLKGERVQHHLESLAKLSQTKTKASKKVLAVDDSRSILSFYRAALSQAGYLVLTASNGKEAIEVLENEGSIDLIITDMNMPVMDGIEFARKIKENPFFSSIPIIMVTTESEHSQTNLATRAGIERIISKPLTPESLFKTISGFL